MGATTVTRRAKETKQPRGGYLKPASFAVRAYEHATPLHALEEENVSPILVGSAVDYLARFMQGAPLDEAFQVPQLGAANVGETPLCEQLMREVRGLDDESIACTCMLAGFDSAFRAGVATYRPVEGIDPNTATIENIKAMVELALKFFREYGPVIMSGLTFKGGYTPTVGAGEGDFLTADTLWDFKVSVKPPTKEHTLQILMYWRMGLHSVHPEYEAVRKLGFFNPRLGAIYTLPVDSIPTDVIEAVETEVIGY